MSTWNSTVWGSALPGGPAAAGGQVLVSDILYTALRIAGVLTAPGRGYGTADKDDALNTFNTMLDNWNSQGLTIFAQARTVFPLVGGQQAYQIGTGAADFNITRPVRLEAAGLISGSLEWELNPLTDDNWQDIPFKGIQSQPSSFYYQNEFPIGSIYLWPVPSNSNYSVALYTDELAGGYTDPSQQVSFPPGYRKALEYCLAVELAILYPRSVMHPSVPQLALDALADIKRLNLPAPEMSCDSAVLSRRGFTTLQGAPLFAGAIGANVVLAFSSIGVTAGQTVVTALQSWTNLMFFRNGVLQTPGADYIAGNSYNFTFTVPFVAGDALVVAHN